MKKYLIALIATIISASELENLLSQSYNKLFDLKFQQNMSDESFNTLSWISPINLSYEKSWSNQLSDKYSSTESFAASIEQPIFKSGGIYFGIKYAKAKANLNSVSIYKEKKALIAQAVELLINYKLTKLNILKLKKQIAINKIDIKNNQELYSAGMVDAISLDNAMIKKEQNEISLLNLEQNLADIKKAFRQISSKDIDILKVPKLSIISKDEFLNKNLDISLAKSNVKVSNYLYKVTATKYLPTVSIGARYSKITPSSIGKSSFKTYNIRVSMPISVNAKNDIQRAKLDYMIKKINLKHSFKNASEFYDSIIKKISLINRQIALNIKELRVYKRLLNSTKRLYRAGQRSKSDVKSLKLSLEIKRLDRKIYKLNKELEILKLYKVIR